ncbi:hypothetical protein PAXRUDRAFT_146469 [Paxillus rubicundulus Ve08.2h10]|uniref:Uncharacterized protein n=1 Tax=Paxillus rubicundulus Ve08.2h10 TaxID=930991 RepID=A0A0D0DMG9_9AGAM|nr:hypothetical protein PAXRUDRAFT_146469 [Paxillus rubicundulus Ve08.2h10]
MGTTKEYVDRAVQTRSVTITSDPATVSAAICLPRSSTPPIASFEDHQSSSTPPPAQRDGAYSHSIPSESPTGPIFAPLISRRPQKRKQAIQGRYPVSELANRRIVSMPENQGETSISPCHNHGIRGVSMPTHVRPVSGPFVDFFSSPSAAGDSFGSFSGRRERVRVVHAPSDVPQTPSPPSSPDSILIIGAGAQFPEGFLRKKYSPEPLMEEDEDWVAWANSPPRPIPALHGPLSLPYARCPSGAEGTIIEEPDNVSRMIWGLGPDDQPHPQPRTDGISASTDATQKFALHGSNQGLPHLQKKAPVSFQVVNQSRTLVPANKSHTKSSNISQTGRRMHLADRRNAVANQALPRIETHHDMTYGLPWIEGSSHPGVPDTLANNVNVSLVNDSRILEWQLSLLRQALKDSSADMDSYNAYSGGLEPVIPPTVTRGFPQPYPRIFVEPRANESVGSVRRQSAVEIAQHYRQQQLYKQALQNQKLQQQNVLPTPPNSSSPQWSSQFSPYLVHRPTFSPDVDGAGSPDRPSAFTSQDYQSNTDASQYLRRIVHERHEPFNHSSTFDANATVSSSQSPQFIPKMNQPAAFRQNSSSLSTVTRYLQQLQALPPIAYHSSLRPGPPPDVPLPPLPCNSRDLTCHIASTHQSPVVPTPPSPKSPQSQPRSISHQNPRSVPLTRLMQRRLSSVPEEDGTMLELSSTVSPRSQSQIAAERQPNVSARSGEDGSHQRYLEVPVVVGAMPRTPSQDSAELAGDYRTTSSVLHHRTSPAKVRLPVVKQQPTVARRGQASEYDNQTKGGNQHGHKKKHRYKRSKGPGSVDERVQTRGLVG